MRLEWKKLNLRKEEQSALRKRFIETGVSSALNDKVPAAKQLQQKKLPCEE